MKIDSQNASIQLGAYLKKVDDPLVTLESKKSSSTAKIRIFDKVHLSEKALEMQQAQLELKQMPEIRTDKVDRIKAAVNQGTYHVPPMTVAQDMMREIFENELVLQKVDTLA
jgi:negative regulator of flagellin synthesis FlgM